jgi:hypothetical protein
MKYPSVFEKNKETDGNLFDILEKIDPQNGKK